MKKFRKKPVVIEAMQFIGTNVDEIFAWVDWDNDPRPMYSQGGTIVIHTLEGDHKTSEGDWIIRGVEGEFYPCKPGIFEKTYEEVD